MPSDIRSFFGGKPAPPASQEVEEVKPSKKRSRAKKVIDDDEDDENEAPPAKKSTPKSKALPKQIPVVEDTTADEFFGKGSKPKRSETVSTKTKPKKETAAETPKSSPKKAATNGSAKRSSARSKKSVNSDDFDNDDFPDDPMDIATPPKKSPSKAALVQTNTKALAQPKLKGHEQDMDEEMAIDVKATDPDADFVVPDDDEEVVEVKPAKKTTAKKRASNVLSDDDEEVGNKKSTKAKPSPAKKAPAKKQKTEEKQDSAELKAIFDSIPTIEPPPPPPKNGEGKAKFAFGSHANSAMPAGALDSRDLPSGEENCLSGLSFVFTGQLATLGREQGQSLVKQYGGKVMTAPSKKTSYVVLGEDAGPKKLQTIQDLSLKVINEQGLFELIKRLPANGGDSAAAEKQAEKRAKEEDEMRKQAWEMEQQERAAAAALTAKAKAAAAVNGKAPAAKPAGKDPNSQLWTVRYAPTQLSQICGNKGQVEKLQRWLRAFPKNQRTGFKLPGADGSGTFRAVMIHGPPGIGKTTAAHLVAKLEGYDVVEQNASDTRSKKLVETGLKGVLSTTSLLGYFGQGNNAVDESKKKLVLIMDEVDGMSAGDRGGVGALAAVCKKSQIPMILICNERKQPKMRPFDFVTYDLGFRRPTTDMIRSRIMTIGYKEGLKLPANVINALIEGSGADIRQVVNMISTAKLNGQDMDYEDSKDMSKAWEKHIVLKPWDMVGKILGGGLFNPAAQSTLNAKQELYFNDHEFAPLMLQENYLGTKPARANKYATDAKKSKLANLQLFSKAAESISDGDLIDRMIHGSQQQWSLMPAHAMASFVRPASFVHGSMAGTKTEFTKWLGKNSNQGKLMRFVKEIQGHMRLRTSVDRYELRQTYLPTLYARLVLRLEKEGKEVVPQLIEMMDWYYLTRDDWDAILELGVGAADMANVKIESQAKATFTRIYNAQSHPLPFIKASQVVAPKKGGFKVKPDLEEAIDDSDDGEVVADDADSKEDEEGELDLSKDKYVKQPKKKKAPAAKKGKKATADDEDEDMEDEKPKKGKGKAKAKK